MQVVRLSTEQREDVSDVTRGKVKSEIMGEVQDMKPLEDRQQYYDVEGEIDPTKKGGIDTHPFEKLKVEGSESSLGQNQGGGVVVCLKKKGGGRGGGGGGWVGGGETSKG